MVGNEILTSRAAAGREERKGRGVCLLGGGGVVMVRED